MELTDAFQQIGGDRRRFYGVDVEVLAPVTCKSRTQ